MPEERCIAHVREFLKTLAPPPPTASVPPPRTAGALPQPAAAAPLMGGAGPAASPSYVQPYR
jgi:hypothetical protein